MLLKKNVRDPIYKPFIRMPTTRIPYVPPRGYGRPEESEFARRNYEDRSLDPNLVRYPVIDTSRYQRQSPLEYELQKTKSPEFGPVPEIPYSQGAQINADAKFESPDDRDFGRRETGQTYYCEPVDEPYYVSEMSPQRTQDRRPEDYGQKDKAQLITTPPVTYPDDLPVEPKLQTQNGGICLPCAGQNVRSILKTPKIREPAEDQTIRRRDAEQCLEQFPPMDEQCGCDYVDELEDEKWRQYQESGQAGKKKPKKGGVQIRGVSYDPDANKQDFYCGVELRKAEDYPIRCYEAFPYAGNTTRELSLKIHGYSDKGTGTKRNADRRLYRDSIGPGCVVKSGDEGEQYHQRKHSDRSHMSQWSPYDPSSGSPDAPRKYGKSKLLRTSDEMLACLNPAASSAMPSEEPRLVRRNVLQFSDIHNLMPIVASNQNTSDVRPHKVKTRLAQKLLKEGLSHSIFEYDLPSTRDRLYRGMIKRTNKSRKHYEDHLEFVDGFVTSKRDAKTVAGSVTYSAASQRTYKDHLGPDMSPNTDEADAFLSRRQGKGAPGLAKLYRQKDFNTSIITRMNESGNDLAYLTGGHKRRIVPPPSVEEQAPRPQRAPRLDAAVDHVRSLMVTDHYLGGRVPPKIRCPSDLTQRKFYRTMIGARTDLPKGLGVRLLCEKHLQT